MQCNFLMIYQLLILSATYKIQFRFCLEWIILLASKSHLGHLGFSWNLWGGYHAGELLVYQHRLASVQRWSLDTRCHSSNKIILRQIVDVKNSCMIHHRRPHQWKTRMAVFFLTFVLCVSKRCLELIGIHWHMQGYHSSSFFGYWDRTFW